MSIVLQLDPPIPMQTPLGRGMAWLVISFGAEMDLRWSVADDETGQIWTWSNQDVRARTNRTEQRFSPEIPGKR